MRRKVPTQTKREKVAGGVVGLPWLLFVLGAPVLSTYSLKASLGAEIPFLIAFLNPLVLWQLFNLSEGLILDWLIVSRITPGFVIIPGSAAADYRDMSHHYRGHVRAGFAMVFLSLIVGAVVTLI